MIISDGWQLAHMVIHSAFEQLNIAYNSNQKKSLDKLVTSVILFQSGMESIYHYISSSNNKVKNDGSFKNKWKNAFIELNSEFNFDSYGDFYSKIRNAIAHPDSKIKLEKINNLNFEAVYFGFKSGWEAYEELSFLTGMPHDKNSWEIMCNMHHLPIMV